jgi:hemerythrin-like metal-binding protein
VVAQEPSPSIASNETLPHGTETVLVVDDELDLVEVAKHSLESLGYRVITAMNGGQALLQLAAHEEIDLLFTDIVMPGGINGHQLVQQAMRTRPELRTLMTSGYAQDAIVSPSSSPAQMILHKPYSQEELAHQVRLTLDSPPTATFILPEQYGEFQSTPSIEWSPDLAIGVDALDEDHQVLLQLISHGRQLLEVEDSGAKTAFILRELRAYSESHFAREEIVMQACGYPELENHKQVHQMLLQKIEALCVSQQQGKLRTTDFAEFLGSWWEDHVRIMDQAITPHCAGKEDLIASALEEFFITQLAQD